MPFVKRNKPNVLQVLSPELGGNPVTIIPGVNNLSDEDLAKCKANSGFMACVKSGAIQIMDTPSSAKPAKSEGTGGNDQGKGKDVVAEIADLNVKDATAIISEMLNKSDLEKIAAADTRTGVQKAVAAQLEKLVIDEDNEDEE